jgi:hypothetical protein
VTRLRKINSTFFFFAWGLVSIGDASADTGSLIGAGTQTLGNQALANGTAQSSQGTVSSYGVDVGVGESDNITLATSNKISQTIATADADFSLKQQSGLYDDNIKGQFGYFDYLQHAYNSQLVGRFDGTGDFALIPQRLIWTVRDDFGEASLDPFAAQTPANQEYINSFSTGPELDFRPGGATFAKLIARYERAQYQTSPFNSNRFLGSFEFGVPLSPRSTVALNVNTERTLFENTLVNTDFDLSSAYASYQLHGSRTDLSGKLGVTRVDQQGVTSSGSLVDLELDRRVSRATTVSFSAGRDLTDALAGFSNLQSGAIGGIGTAQAAVTSGVYTLSYAQLASRFARERTTFNVSARWSRDQYATGVPVQVIGLTQASTTATNGSALDSSTRGGEFSFEERLTRVLSAQLLGSYYDLEYPYANFSINAGATRYQDSRLGGGLIFRPGHALDIRLRYQHLDRVVAGVGSGTGYRDNVVFLTVGYRPRLANDAAATP